MPANRSGKPKFKNAETHMANTANLSTICSEIDDFLRIGEIFDYPNALNGLQIENSGCVTNLGAAVDASLATIDMAIAHGVDLLLVHHGIFWGGLNRIVGPYYKKLQRAIASNLAIYSVHLPLDMHAEIGNNALLLRALDLPNPEPFFFKLNNHLGLASNVVLDRDELVNRLESVLKSEVWICRGGPQKTRRIGIVTGGAGAELETAAREGVDTFVTGEGPHHTFALAEELQINLIYGGHYATETFGIQALAERFATQYHLPWCFLDHASGL
jgi:dinuclear metal center YbgI/SA1388 family protein